MKIESIFPKNNVRLSIRAVQQIILSLSNPEDSRAKPPKLTLDKFNVEVLSWQSCWDQYSVAIHTNSSLSEIEKFNLA